MIVRISVDTSDLLATWPEFWAIVLSCLWLYFSFAFLIIWPPCGGGDYTILSDKCDYCYKNLIESDTYYQFQYLYYDSL